LEGEVVRQEKNSSTLLVLALTICPLLLILFILTLPPFKQIYGTIFETLFLFMIFLLPFFGIGGIFQFSSLSPSKKIICSVVYFAVMLIPVGFTAIFVGCSWAGACF
jgi:hypothetical protein